MKNVAVLLTNPARPALDPNTVQSAVEILRSGGATVGTPDWLCPEVACDIPFDGPAAGLGMTGIDAVVVPAANRRKKLLVADMESTMIENEMLDELAEYLGLREKISAITARSMNGEIDFPTALAERVLLLKGLPTDKLAEAAARIRYMPGGATLVATMRKNGAYCALVSGGFTFYTAMVRKRLGFDIDQANTLAEEGGALAGFVVPPILDRDAKLATLKRFAAERGLALGDTAAVGDGANDLAMLKSAEGAGGLGVAFHAKPAVAAQVSARIDHGDLSALLYLQGYRRQEFVEAT